MKKTTLEEVKDPDCFHEISTEVLRRGDDDWASFIAEYSSNSSPEDLAEALGRGKDDLNSRCAAEDLNCPPEALAEVLRRGNDDWVSRCAVNNPNCPPQEAIKWKMQTGQITKEDPRIHYIEKQKEDEDLKKLKQLIESNQ